MQPEFHVRLEEPQLLAALPMFQVAVAPDRLQPDGTWNGTPLRNTLPGLEPAGSVVTQQFCVLS